MIGLPTSLEVNEKEYAIRSDFRDVINILTAYNDVFSDVKETDAQCKARICLTVLYEDDIPPEEVEEAYKKALWFIDCGGRYHESDKPPIKLMDWSQDEQLLFPAINRIAGHETRQDAYMHWWTFMGLYMEIGECLFSTVVSIRRKLETGKRLEKYEQEFYRENKSIINLKKTLTSEEQKEEEFEKEFLKNLIG